MENKKTRFESDAENADRRTWHLTLLSVVIILYLTLVLLTLHFTGFLEGRNLLGIPLVAMRYVVYLCVLALLFCAYMVVTQRKLRVFSHAISRQEKTARQLTRNVEVLSSLLEVSSSINSQQQLSGILDIITQQMLNSFHADRSSIMLLDDHSQTLKTESACGVGAELAKDARIPVGQGISGWVLANSQPLLLNGQVDSEKFPGTEKKNRPISSSLCVPLTMAEKSIGVLNVSLMNSERSFSENDLQVLAIFANNAAVAIHNSLLQKEKDRRVRLQTMLGQLHSPQVVQKLVERIEEGTKPTSVREQVELTILFSDIRGFSSMLTKVEPEDIMGFLDDFYNVMNKAVFDNDGSIDKFIGDEVMAFFGAPIALSNSTTSGIQTATQMLDYFKKLKIRYAERSPHFNSLGLGIGVNTGMVIVGNVGSQSRYEYTVIGQAVNLARRLCAHAEADQILTTQRTIKKANGMARSHLLEKVRFKGFSESVTVHVVDSLPGQELDENEL